jgi:xylulokinase
MADSTLKCVLAIDLGSSGPKVSVVNQNGEIMATRSGQFQTLYTKNGKGVEQDAEQWWAQILQLSKEAIDESGTARYIVAIGTCAQYFSSVPVDKNGNAVHNAIMWEDTRASQYTRKVMGGFPSMQGYNIFRLLRWLYAVGIPPILLGVDAGSHMLLLKTKCRRYGTKHTRYWNPPIF